MTTYPARVDGRDTSVTVTPEGLDLPDRSIPWHAVDTLADDGIRLVLGVAEGVAGSPTTVEIGHLGAQRDAVAQQMREARGVARRASLGQANLEVAETFESRGAHGVADITALPHGLIIEPRGALATFVPWGLVADAARDGYRFTLVLRFGSDVVVAGLGRRSDEFAEVVSRLRSDLRRSARAAVQPWNVSDLPWEDGWALTDPGAVDAWLSRLDEVESVVLREACDDLRAGIFTEGGKQDLPFMIARCGDSRVLVEGVGDEDRATFVFDSGDVARVNAALLLVSFRRDLLALPEPELGRWAAAIRTQPDVAWLRSVLHARVIHDDRWGPGIREAAT